MPEYNWIGDGVFTVSQLLPPEECAELVARSESLGFGDAPINNVFGGEIRKDIRSNDRVIHEMPEYAEQLWSRTQEYVPTSYHGRRAVGLNERFRFYRYDPGQQFDWHRDGSFERPNGERSLITILIYLNDGFVGGETSFDEPSLGLGQRYDVVPQTGLALFFDHPLLHKGQPVQSGRKYVLRTDVMYSPVR
jgi:hypothetical protein